MKSKEPWSLTKTGQYCSQTIVSSTRDSLADCNAYCVQNGATRLTYFQTKMCLCCIADSALADAISTAEIYEFGGSCVYVNIHTNIFTIYINVIYMQKLKIEIFLLLLCLLGAETCADGIKNQGEDKVDCGGPCLPCRK